MRPADRADFAYEFVERHRDSFGDTTRVDEHNRAAMAENEFEHSLVNGGPDGWRALGRPLRVAPCLGGLDGRAGQSGHVFDGGLDANVKNPLCRRVDHRYRPAAFPGKVTGHEL